jgi:hypothetical protein
MVIGQTRIYPLCTRNVIQTLQHAFYICPAMKVVWERMKRIRILAGKLHGLERWDLILYRDLGRPLPRGRQPYDEGILWEAGKNAPSTRILRGTSLNNPHMVLMVPALRAQSQRRDFLHRGHTLQVLASNI